MRNGFGVRTASLIVVMMLVAAFGTLVGTTSAGAAPRQALINASTVSGSPSQEEQIATNLGFAVTVVDDATWASMTATDFGQYDLLIAGDPTCGTLPAGLVSSASVFGPVVLGTAGGRTQAGNRVVVGTDPVYHDFGDFTSPGARGTIIREGIAFAANGQPGTTGMYFDPTCNAATTGSSDQTLTVLNAISAGAGAWTGDPDPPCGGSVSLIASNPSFADLTTSSLQGWSCSVHESFPTFTSDWSALAVATDTTTTPTCGVDPGTGLNACGEAYILIAGSSIVVESQVISVSPLDSTNPAGTSHTVTANVHVIGGSPVVVGQHVDFTVTGQNAGVTGTCVPIDCTSDVMGNVAFTYFDGAGAGDDTIKASFTDNVGSLQTATAQKHWVTAPTHKLTVNIVGSGSVVSAPTGIDCGTTCSADFAEGSSVALTSTPATGFAFTGWSGACSGAGACSVTMSLDQSVTATFTEVPTHTLGVGIMGSGSVVSSPGTINCPGGCSEDFAEGTSVTLTATPAAGFVFSGWSGACAGTGACVVALSADLSVTATFTETPISGLAGAFVIGDESAGNLAVGTKVNFWGAQWSKHNELSGGKAPAAMKGFAESPTTPACGVNWRTRPGNSASPPETLPSQILVIVTSKATKSGASISGDTVQVVLVNVGPGYGPDPGHPGNGTIAATVCSTTSPTSDSAGGDTVTNVDDQDGRSSDVAPGSDVAGSPDMAGPTGLPSATLGRPYSTALDAPGGVTPYRWKRIGKLPKGLKLDARTGIVAGIPKENGTFTFTVEAKYKTKAPKQPAVSHVATGAVSITVT